MKVKFVYEPLTGGKHSVFLVGEFNNWNPESHPMKEEFGIYSIEIPLEKGEYRYKFLVDGNWLTDMKASDFEEDGFGGLNSKIFVGEKNQRDKRYPVRFKTAMIKGEGYLFGSFNKWVKKEYKLFSAKGKSFCDLLLPAGIYEYSFSYHNDNHKQELYSIKVPTDENYYDFSPIYEIEKLNTEIKISHFRYDIYRLEILVPKHYIQDIFVNNKIVNIPFTCFYSYDEISVYHCFLKKGVTDFLIKINFRNSDIDFYFNFEDVDVVGSNLETIKINYNYLDNFDVPEWTKDTVIYQIFLDRFCNGNKLIDPSFTEWYYSRRQNPLSAGVRNSQYTFINNWNDFEGLKDHPNKHYFFYGGDLAGVRRKLEYLKKLGITMIYFNPLVQAESNHKYDAIDYFKIDPHFGTNEEFKELVELLHKNGIRLIVDFAFNHTGVCTKQFQDIIKKGQTSQYWDWYEWKKWPLPENIDNDFNPLEYYQCWWGHATLPDLDYDKSRPHPYENEIINIEEADVNEGVVNFILSVAEFWLREFGIDGFRLDVPNEVPFWFWKLFRKKVKEINPEAYLVGEIWHNAEKWCNADYFDAVMNYNYFREPILRFFAMKELNSKTFIQLILKGLESYPFQVTQNLMNLLGSHDTFRFYEACQGDASRFKMAIMFQMTFWGIPHIWYGDEIGMFGKHDPDNRRPFDWNYHQNETSVEILEFYKKMIYLRKKFNLFNNASYEILEYENDFLVYVRRSGDVKLLFLINNSHENHKYKLEGKYYDFIREEELSGEIIVFQKDIKYLVLYEGKNLDHYSDIKEIV